MVEELREKFRWKLNAFIKLIMLDWKKWESNPESSLSLAVTLNSLILSNIRHTAVVSAFIQKKSTPFAKKNAK